MDLVYIYGPPAAGKFTVGSALAALTGYKLFHNHLSIAAVEPVFEFGSATFWRLVHQIREAVIMAAVDASVDLVVTNVYAHPGDLAQTLRRFEVTETAGGRVCLVQLTCSLDELERRMPLPGREAMNKLVDVQTFHEVRQTTDVFSPIPQRSSLTIDTTNLSPVDAAMRIIRHYDLTLKHDR